MSNSVFQLEMSAGSIHESLNVISDYQKHFRLREMSGRMFAEEVNNRWGLPQYVIISGSKAMTVMFMGFEALRYSDFDLCIYNKGKCNES